MTLCISCKGKGLCGREQCPVIHRFHAQMKTIPRADYVGTSPSIFVGSYRYPHVTAGPLLTSDGDHPPDWINRDLTIADIVSIRAQTIRATTVPHRYEENMQEIARSSIPLGVETAFEKPISFDLRFDGMVAPMGLTGDIRSFDLLDTAKVERVVERITSDADLPAAEACQELTHSGTDTYRIISLMSAGLLGTEKGRHMVPTRWAITAVDDTLGKNLKPQVFRFTEYPQISLFYSKKFGNAIAIILLPGDWQFEMIEIWGKQSLWGGDQETIIADHEGRTKTGYSPITGAYYSARLAVLEYLTKVKRNARVVVIRWITSEYWAPLGTWVIREVTRQAMSSNPVHYETVPEVTTATSATLGMDRWVPHSSLLAQIRTQRTLTDFFRT
ncbi:MAG: hypothetical protein LUQ50_09325 [Methanospirillum sp.]|uniref:hypothetical protein n=1 Tax=Methanospirillum sp. TaxID=45200 RepID=UPI00237300CC|nr:hypothetical protein [Methanospirillum sp.]MDD1729259.1 hypothetical protein [Methanospirillum sp.]